MEASRTSFYGLVARAGLGQDGSTDIVVCMVRHGQLPLPPLQFWSLGASPGGLRSLGERGETLRLQALYVYKVTKARVGR